MGLDSSPDQFAVGDSSTFFYGDFPGKIIKLTFHP